MLLWRQNPHEECTSACSEIRGTHSFQVASRWAQTYCCFSCKVSAKVGNCLCLVQGVCADTASCDLTAVVLTTSIEEVQRALEVAVARQESPVGRQDEIVVMAGRGQGD